MAQPPFGFQQQIDPNLLSQLAQSGNNSGWGPVVQQLTGAVQQFQQGQQQKQKQAQLGQLLQQMRGTPQGASAPTQIPPGQPMTAGLGNMGQDVTMSNPQQAQPPQAQQPPMAGGMDPNALLGAYAKIDPQGAQELLQKNMMKQFGPQAPVKPTSPWRIVPNMMSKAGKPIQQNEQTGEVREAPLDALQSSPRSNAMQSRTDYLNKSLDYKQRDLLMKGTNLPGQQLKVLTQNNMRADRALDLLSAPQVTWQKLNFALTDLSAIMQGGAPHKEEILNSQFPSWRQKVAKYRTFSTGQPDANVPAPIKNEVIGMVNSLKKVDNQFLQQNLQNQEQMLGPTIQGFDKVKPMIEQGTKNFTQGLGSNQKSKTGPYSDKAKEARYQAYLKAHPNG